MRAQSITRSSGQGQCKSLVMGFWADASKAGLGRKPDTFVKFRMKFFNFPLHGCLESVKLLTLGMQIRSGDLSCSVD